MYGQLAMKYSIGFNVIMKICILTNRDLASQLALDYLVQQLGHHELSIFISERVGANHSYIEPLQELADFEAQAMSSRAMGFEAIAASAGCKLQGFVDLGNQINSPEGCARINSCRPDLIISIRFGLIIKQPILAIPKYGVINLHSGLLPEYRGVMATFRAMLNGESYIGSTLHLISDGGIDTGEIISMSKIPLDFGKSYLINVLRLYAQGCQQILEAVTALENKQMLVSQPQKANGHYYSFPNIQEIERFRSEGYRLFDPTDLTLIKDWQL